MECMTMRLQDSHTNLVVVVVGTATVVVVASVGVAGVVGVKVAS